MKWGLLTSCLVVVVQSLSGVSLSEKPWTAAHQAALSFTVPQSLLRFMSIESVMVSDHLILYCPLLLPSILPSIRVFSSESALCIRWPKYCSFSINASNEYSGLVSFRMDWLDLLAVQGTLKCLLQYHSSEASILWCSAFVMVQFSNLYMTTGETIALTRRTFVGKVMLLHFNTLSRLVIAFLPRSKRLLILCLLSRSFWDDTYIMDQAQCCEVRKHLINNAASYCVCNCPCISDHLRTVIKIYDFFEFLISVCSQPS